MFEYSSLSIDSAIPIEEIHGYFAEIGAAWHPDNYYTFRDLAIGIVSSKHVGFANINVVRHTITVICGERTAAENFLTDFRLRFLSAGG